MTNEDQLPIMLSQINKLGELKNDFNSYGSSAPNTTACDLARLVARLLVEQEMIPSNIDASTDGGIGFAFTSGKRSADIEVFNEGDILAMKNNVMNNGVPYVWKIDVNETDIIKSIKRIKDFVYINNDDI